MEEPVMDLCAHTFERAAIHDWLDVGHSCCPISRKPLQKEDLMPNHQLGERIDCWRWHQEQQQDGLIRVVEDSTCSLSMNDEEVVKHGDGYDPEEGLGKNVSGSPKRTRSSKIQYKAVLPAEFMLLPQEREVLAVVRIRREQHEAQRRKERCYIILSGVIVGAALILIVAFVAYFIRMRRDKGEDVGQQSVSPV